MPPKLDHSLWSEAFFDLRKWFYILWHRLSASTFSIGKIVTICIRSIVIFWPLGIAYRNGWDKAWLWLVLYFLCILYIRRHDLSPANMLFQHEGYAQRKAHLAAAILLLDIRVRAGSGLTDDEKGKIRKHALDAIVSYVRVCLSDVNQTKIFANLLVEDGDDLVIVQRDSACKRDATGRYPKRDMLAWQAIHSGTTVGFGDIRHAYPSTPHGKPYNSVLVIPLVAVSNNPKGTRIVGAVSIDSSELFHFNTYENDLETSLLPYTQLLTSTLI